MEGLVISIFLYNKYVAPRELIWREWLIYSINMSLAGARMEGLVFSIFLSNKYVAPLELLGGVGYFFLSICTINRSLRGSSSFYYI